jgi:hypothetical protein
MSRVATPPKVQPTSPVYKVPHEKIAMRAYEKWCQHGCNHGTDLQDWYDAERELLGEMAKVTTSPLRR